MKRFTDYINLREGEDDPTQMGQKRSVERLASLAFERFPKETEEFFKDLADRDSDIKEELDLTKKNMGDNPTPSAYPSNDPNKRRSKFSDDAIALSTADGASSQTEDY